MTSLFAIILGIFGAVTVLSPSTATFICIAALPLYVLRFSVLGLPTNLFEMLVLVLFVISIVRGPWSRFVPVVAMLKKIQPPLVLIAAGLAVGLWVAPDRLVALGIIKSWFLVPIILAGLITYFIPSKQPFELTSKALLLSTLPLSLFALWQVGTGHFVTIDGRASGWFTSANYLSLYMVPILLLALGWLKTEKSWKSMLGWVIWILGVVSVYFSFSFGGWIALAIGLATFLWFSQPQPQPRKLIIPGVVALALLGVLYIANPRFAHMFDFAERSSASVRLQVWATGALMVRDHWLTGLGLGSFQGNYLAYALRLFHPPIETIILHPHNFLLQIWISLGLLGVIGFGLLVIQWGYQAARIGAGLPRASLLAAMAAILAHGVIENVYFKNDLSVVFWLILALTFLPHVLQPKN